jgi:uncharacterized membrane protein
MTLLILGLILFLGVHSVRIVADDWRTTTRARIGANAWKGLFSLLSLAGFLLILFGFGQVRLEPIVIWHPPTAMRHLAALLTLLAFILLAAAYVPRNGIKAAVHHPMVLSVKVWALAHLLANGWLADIVLFGAFLLWAVLDFRAARRRDRTFNITYAAGTTTGTMLTLIVGAAAWSLFAFVLHGLLIGVRPIG